MSLCDRNELSPLNIALLNKHESTAKLLLDNDADMNIETLLLER